MDARSDRHNATRARILQTAWQLSADQGLTGWSLRDLAAAVGMRAPSLYVYFASKDAIFDAMFAQGYTAMLAAGDELYPSLPNGRREVLRYWARHFLEFALADNARMQLMFWRVIPGFEPSPESYAVSQQVSTAALQQLAKIGVPPESAYLWFAMLSGLMTQQAANDPGGDSWRNYTDAMADMFADRYLPD